MLHDAGYGQCASDRHDVTADPDPRRARSTWCTRGCCSSTSPSGSRCCARLWDAVAPGGHLLVQDYDVRSHQRAARARQRRGGRPGPDRRVHRRGLRRDVGARLPELFAQAGVGAPDGTDVAGRLEPLATGQRMLSAVYRSILPAALAHGVTTETRPRRSCRRSTATPSGSPNARRCGRS